MPRILRSGNKKTKTTRCSCEHSDNHNKGSFSRESLKKKNSLSKRSLQVDNEETNRTRTAGSSTNPKPSSAVKNKTGTMKGKDKISNKKVVSPARTSTRKLTKSAVQNQPKELVQLVQGHTEDFKPSEANGKESRNRQTRLRQLKQNASSSEVIRYVKKLCLKKAPTSNTAKSIELKTKKEPGGCKVRLVQLSIEDFKDGQVTGQKQTKNGQNKQSPKTVSKRSGCLSDAKTCPKVHAESSVSLKRLRSRKPVKYTDISVEATKIEEKTNGKKVPIYQQNTNVEKPSKRQGDQYEFDSDTEKHKQRKRRKLDDSSSDQFNKTIQNILKNIANKSMKKKRKVIFSDGNKKKEMAKLNVQLLHTINNNNNQLKSKTASVNGKKEKATSTKTKNLQHFAVNTLKNNSQIRPCVINNINLTSTPKVDVNKNNPTIKKDLSNLVKEKQDTDLDVMDSPVIDYSDSDEEYFIVPSTNENNKPSKVDILSNIQLKPRKELNLSIASPRMFKDGQPNANSTLLNNVLSPWRFNDINIKRNPHFISIKPSSLPYINQDMVLDHNIVDKLNESSKIEIENLPQPENRRNNTNKPLMQQTLNDYLNCKNENKENVENTKVSLFDSDELSPIKNRSRISSKHDVVKRRILGEINENVVENKVPSPVQSLQESHLHEYVNSGKTGQDPTNFGFDSVEEKDNDENVPAQEKDNRPFRFSINVNDKKYQRKRKLRMKKVETTPQSDEDSSDSDDDDSDTDSEKGQIKLFEDFQNTQELLEKQEEKTAMLKKCRNRENSKNFQKQKKRRDVRTKEEEQQAEKWAAAFNSMCEEIEQFPLEIE